MTLSARSTSTSPGVFELRTPADLRRKLIADLSQLKSRPTDSYSAFNFFVTAEALLDWTYPGRAATPRRTLEKKGSIPLQICSHVASGAKHFQVEDSRHRSVSGTHAGGGFFPASYFGPRYWGSSYWSKPHLVVKLTGAAADLYGPSIPALTLGEIVLAYWNEHPLLL